MPLRPRQQRFVEEYLLDLDIKHAAIRAGYRPSGAYHQGSRLLRQPAIAAAVAAAMTARSARTGVTRGRVLAEYAKIAFADMRALADWGPDRITIADSAAISEEASAAIALIEEAGSDGAQGLHLKTFSKPHALDALATLLHPRQEASPPLAPRPRDGQHDDGPA